jgi:hypothetical protein
MTGQGGNIELQGCVNTAGKPFVITIVNGEPFGQLTPAEALNFGIRAIQASQEAERDAALVNSMRASGFDDFTVFGMLTMIREHRSQVDPDPREDVEPR